MRCSLKSVTTLITCMCITHKAFSSDIAPYKGGNVIEEDTFNENKYGLNGFVRFSNFTVVYLEGSTVRLLCPFGFSYESSFEWFKEDEGKMLPYEYNEDLRYIELEDVTKADSGTYACKACTVFDCSLAYLILKVLSESEEKEYISNHNKDSTEIVQFSNDSVTTIEGRNAHLTCLNPVGFREIKFEWYKEDEGKLIPYGNSKDLDILILKNVTSTDSGIYACKTCTSNDCSLIYIKLTVKSLSPISEDDITANKYGMNTITKFSNLTLTHLVGSTVRLVCPYKVVGESTVEWFEEDKGQLRTYGQGLRYLALEDVTKADSGTYACKACTVYDCILAYFKLSIISENEKKEDTFNGNKDFNKIVQFSNETATFLEGSDVNLRCPTKIGISGSTFEWFKEDEGKLQPYENSKDVETVTLKDITVADSGTYACKTCMFRECSMMYIKLTVRKRTYLEEPHSGTTIYEDTTMTGPQSETKTYYETTIPKDTQPNKVLTSTIIKLGVVLLFLIAGTYILINIMIGFCKKKKRERTRRRLAREISRAAKLPHCTKKIVVERQTCTIDEQTPSSRANETDILMMPLVRIENLVLRKHDGQLPKYELPFDPAWEVPRDSLIMGRVLGEGAFGKVVQAEARRTFQQRKNTTVAVKMLKDNHTDNDLVQFVKEMEVMKMIGKHCNIVNLLGCCTQEGPLLFVIEFAPHGNVRDFLREHRSCLRIRKDCNCLTERDLVTFAYQVAKGMDYLSSRKYIHGDLAARNVLVSNDYVLKISDFGFARKLQQKDYYRRKINGVLPIKWMAPECIFDNVYTTQSDVWSYGILLWEFMTLGGSPYPSVANIGQLYKMLKGGYRMEKPEYCTSEMYSMMTECWKYEPAERPPFGKLVEMMNAIVAFTTTVEYLELSQSEQGIPAEEADVSVPTPISREEQEGKEDLSLSDRVS